MAVDEEVDEDLGQDVDEGAAADTVEDALAALDLARRRFINVVGHELRTPVTTLRGLTEELIDADPDVVAREVVPALVRNARRVEALLDDLLIAADITTVLPVGQPEPVDLVATAQAIWDNMEATDELVLTGDTEAVALLRPGAADHILERVLDNAHRYGEPPVELRAATRQGRVTITVSSRGPELAADDLRLAFELFYRGEGAVTTAPGFGLGLTVARGLARQDGGDVVLAARDQGGLEVTIEAPAPT
jgi:signal transduction histidine kinase